MKRGMRIFGLVLIFIISSRVLAQIGLGADIVSRYVWRGTDLGNSASVQPSLSYTKGSFEFGAWGSYALTDGGANENDLYLTYTSGKLSATITDYYFPESMDLFNYKDKDSIHWLEASASCSFGKLNLMGGYFFSGDPDNSLYLEAGYDFYNKEDISARLIVGAGDGVYVSDSDKLDIVNVGISTSSGPVSVSYIINPQAETNYLVFGYTF